MRRVLCVVLGGLMLAGAGAAPGLGTGAGEGTELQGDRQAGRALAGQCRTCHGLDGYATLPVAPHIGGEPAAYLAAQLRAFRDGTRSHEMMSIVAANLTDAQIADLAAWYGGHLASATLDADPEDAPELCAGCHGANGLHEVEDAPNLAGESSLYIAEQLKAFRSGKRSHEAMSAIAADLGDEDIRAVADWYAAVTLRIEQMD